MQTATGSGDKDRLNACRRNATHEQNNKASTTTTLIVPGIEHNALSVTLLDHTDRILTKGEASEISFGNIEPTTASAVAYTVYGYANGSSSGTQVSTSTIGDPTQPVKIKIPAATGSADAYDVYRIRFNLTKYAGKPEMNDEDCHVWFTFVAEER